MTLDTAVLADLERKKIAAVLRRVNWPLDGHGRYGSIPSSQVNDAASRLYSAGIRVGVCRSIHGQAKSLTTKFS